jgi:hypothetical protein
MESDIQAKVRLEASRNGIRLWRNNVGALKTPDGSYLRYGLANDSPHLNAVFKSSDLIGIRPILITQDMVGKTIGQFVAREVKAPGWLYRDTQRERAQRAFIDLINKLGGDAAFTTGDEEGTL